MKVEITTAAVDQRMAKPADLVALDASLSTDDARKYLDAAGAIAEGREGLRYPPWRQAYALRLAGSDSTELLLYSKPVESVALTDLNGTTVDATTYRVTGNGIGILDRVERDAGWVKIFTGSYGISGVADPDSEKDAWIATTTTGWIMPGQIAVRADSTAYKATLGTTSSDNPATGSPYLVGSWVRSEDPRQVLRFECTTAGTTAASEPAGLTAAATVAGTAITDGTAVFTARAAHELPADLAQQVLRLALHLKQTEKTTEDVRRRRSDKVEVEYHQIGSKDAIPTAILSTFEAYR
jgi:hypothetical protein